MRVEDRCKSCKNKWELETPDPDRICDYCNDGSKYEIGKSHDRVETAYKKMKLRISYLYTDGDLGRDSFQDLMNYLYELDKELSLFGFDTNRI